MSKLTKLLQATASLFLSMMMLPALLAAQIDSLPQQTTVAGTNVADTLSPDSTKIIENAPPWISPRTGVCSS